MQKSVPVFWSRWIQFLSLLLIVYGLAMVFVPEVMISTVVSALLYGNNAGLHSAFVATTQPQATFLRALSGLLGTVTVGWAIQIGWIAHVPFRKGERWAWYSLAMSICVWAILEFYFKLAGGISGIGLVAHFGLLIAFAVPLGATYSRFRS